MDTSIFMNLEKMPANEDLKLPLGNLYQLWMELREFVFLKYPTAVEEWHISIKKFGWSYRIKDKKRAIVYLSPRKNRFKVTMVFGQKASNQIMESEISEPIKATLMDSQVYAEGRVIRLEILDRSLISDVKKLIEIKILN